MDQRLPHLLLLPDALALIGAPACACDGAGIVTAVNPELTRLLGADITGAPLGGLLSGAGQSLIGRHDPARACEAMSHYALDRIGDVVALLRGGAVILALGVKAAQRPAIEA